MRYIDADALLNRMPDGLPYKASVKRIVMQAPTADVVEVEHGSFVWIADDSPMCNICGEVFDTNDNADAGLWKFCPNCGATMDGERREG